MAPIRSARQGGLIPHWAKEVSPYVIISHLRGRAAAPLPVCCLCCSAESFTSRILRTIKTLPYIICKLFHKRGCNEREHLLSDAGCNSKIRGLGRSISFLLAGAQDYNRTYNRKDEQMKAKTKRWTLFLPAILAGLVFLSACADLKSIRVFADKSADLAGYTSLSADYPRSVERQKRYQEEKYHAKLDEELQKRNAQQPALLALHKGVEEYMSALGALASDELVSCDQSVDALAGEIKKAKLIDDSKADAFASLTKLIAKASTDLYRQKKLKQIIGEANNDFQTVIIALSDIVGKDFTSSLDNEAVAVDKYYKKIITIAEKAPPQQAAIELLKERWQERRDEVKVKREACVLYVKTLKSIGEGHQMLFDNKDHLSTKQVANSINAYSKEVSALYKQIKELK